MDIKPLHDDKNYRDAMREIETLMNADEGTPEGDRLYVLVTLVEAYENRHFPLDLPDPEGATKPIHFKAMGSSAPTRSTLPKP